MDIMGNILPPTLILGGLGVVFGLGLSYASKIFAVDIDKRIAMIKEVLPGANCGACGYPGCDAFATGVVEGSAKIDGCPVGGYETASKIAEIMGATVDECEKKVARIFCRGTYSASKEKYDYYGIEDCFTASQVFGGQKACAHGCLGFGNCKDACAFDAIVIEEGIARILEENCTGCGKCVEACPQNIIELVPEKKRYAVLCRSKDKGAITRKSCSVGCIGCMKCVKACPKDAISMVDNHAVIDTEKCVNCGVCVKVCPTSAIKKL